MPYRGTPCHNHIIKTTGILKWSWATFGPDIALSSSFQTQSIPLLHLISKICPEMPVIFIDTGFHFPETLAFRDEIVARFNLRIVVVKPEYPGLRKDPPQNDLYRKDPDLCCYIHKVRPIQNYLKKLRAWVTGIRSDQTDVRKQLPVIKRLSTGLFKIHPMLHWSYHDVFAYIFNNKLPVHPLFEKGFLSIGCSCCTAPVQKKQYERSGRWAWTDKTECGLHTELINNIS